MELTEKLSSRISKSDYCWNWTGGKNPGGYGQIGVNGKILRVHRIMYETHKGLIPSNLEVDHLCNNKGCVNPDHLELVTHAENIRRADMSKPRPRRGLKEQGPCFHCGKLTPKGWVYCTTTCKSRAFFKKLKEKTNNNLESKDNG